jgi:hypothetical protein
MNSTCAPAVEEPVEAADRLLPATDAHERRAPLRHEPSDQRPVEGDEARARERPGRAGLLPALLVQDDQLVEDRVGVPHRRRPVVLQLAERLQRAAHALAPAAAQAGEHVVAGEQVGDRALERSRDRRRAGRQQRGRVLCVQAVEPQTIPARLGLERLDQRRREPRALAVADQQSIALDEDRRAGRLAGGAEMPGARTHQARRRLGHERDPARTRAPLRDQEAVGDDVAVVLEPGAGPHPRAAQRRLGDLGLEREPEPSGLVAFARGEHAHDHRAGDHGRACHTPHVRITLVGMW